MRMVQTPFAVVASMSCSIKTGHVNGSFCHWDCTLRMNDLCCNIGARQKTGSEAMC